MLRALARLVSYKQQQLLLFEQGEDLRLHKSLTREQNYVQTCPWRRADVYERSLYLIYCLQEKRLLEALGREQKSAAEKLGILAWQKAKNL